MAFYISLLLAVSVLGLLSRSWRQRWEERKRLTSERPAVEVQREQRSEKLSEQLSTRIGTEFVTLRDRLGKVTAQSPAWATRVQQMVTQPSWPRTTNNTPDLAHRFREWAVTKLQQEPATTAWLAALSPKANLAFTQQVAEFCEEMGFDLAALVDGRLAHVPQAAQQATEIVRFYCNANYTAALSQPDFDATKRFLAYLRAPLQKRNQAFGQQLYTNLVEKQLVTPPTGSAPITDPQVVEAICQAATSHSTSFSMVLNEVVRQNEM